MAKNANSHEQFSMDQAMAFAGTPAGRQLLAIIQSKGNFDIEKAKSLAESGKMIEAAKNNIANKRTVSFFSFFICPSS